MTKFLTILSFIPWILCYLKYCFNMTAEIHQQIITFDWFKKSFFKIFQFESLILFAVFVFFARYKKELAYIMLFTAICLYLFAASFHDQRHPNKKIKLNNINYFVIVFSLLLAVVPFIFYFNTNHPIITYLILFGYLFFARLIVLIGHLIYSWIPKFRRNKLKIV